MEPTAGWRSSTDTRAERARVAPRRVVVGRIRGAHGLRGRIRVHSSGDAPDLLLGLTRVILARSEDDPDAVEYPVESAVAGREDEVRMRLSGLRRREQAEELRGWLLMADPSDFEPLAPGEYWSFQLVGCRVETRDGRAIGTVREIWHTAAQEVLIVEGDGGREQLIPAVRELLPEVDVEDRRIVVEAIPGLLDES